jgi:hypothetical protein
MDTVAAGRPLIELAMSCHRADVPLLLIGPHGIGKSELLQQAAAELAIGCVVFDLSLMEPVDLLGLPREKDGQTVYSPPAALPRKGRGFLVFEELNRCPAYMRSPCLQLLTARRLNDYALPSGWLPVAAINPPEEDGYEVVELDPALLSRFVKVAVKADRSEWLAWARGQGVHEQVLQYVAVDLSVFDSPLSNPRAWTYVAKFLSVRDGDSSVTAAAIQPSTLRAIVCGLVGPQRAASFFTFLKSGERPLEADEVLDDYEAHRDRFRIWVETGRLDPIKTSLLAMMTRLQAKVRYEEARRDTKAWRNLGLFLTDQPGDLRKEAEQFFRERHYEWPVSVQSHTRGRKKKP